MIFLLERSSSSGYAKCVFMVLFTVVCTNYRAVILYLGIQSNATYFLEIHLSNYFSDLLPDSFHISCSSLQNLTNNILHRPVVYIQFYLIIFSTVI